MLRSINFGTDIFLLATERRFSMLLWSLWESAINRYEVEAGYSSERKAFVPLKRENAALLSVEAEKTLEAVKTKRRLRPEACSQCDTRHFRLITFGG